MFPLRDENPLASVPYATIALITMNAVVWFAIQGAGTERPLAESLCL